MAVNICPVKVQQERMSDTLFDKDFILCVGSCDGPRETFVQVRRFGGIVGRLVERPALVCDTSGDIVLVTLGDRILKANGITTSVE